MLARKIDHLCDLGFGDFITEHAADADALLMDMKHHPRRILHTHLEKALKAEDDEFHRRVIIIQHQHLVGRRLFRACARFGGDANVRATIFIVVIIICHQNSHRVGIWHCPGEGQDDIVIKDMKTATPEAGMAVFQY